MQRKAICIMGPTAAGKTDLAIELLNYIDGEIISVDSAMIYKSMDIGTAKPSAQELELAPHHMIDICDPSEAYSAGDFCKDVKMLMGEVWGRGNIPILVGGTMMYFKALQQGIANMPSSDPKVREEILNEAKEQGWQHIHEELKKVDPESANRIHPNDPQRLQRALEVYRISGKPLSDWWDSENNNEIDFDCEYLNIALMPEDRAELHKRIEVRFKCMLDNGFIEEVKKLKARRDLNLDMPSMRCVGYRQVWQYLDGELSHDEMVERGIIATRQLAKRQMTWVRSWQDVHILPVGDDNLNALLAFL